MIEPRQALLAMRHAAGRRRGALAMELLRRPWPVQLCEDTEWRPGQRDWQVAGRQLAAIQALGIRMIPAWQLPARLRRVRPLPPVLFVRGDPRLVWRAAVAVVGSRKAAPTAREWARRQATTAARDGLLVVSGGALGVDGAAHVGALEAGDATLVYLGVAIDRLYPVPHRRLFEAIIARGGALVSEHAPGEQTAAWAHAQRNRFIAAHAQCLLMAEAGAKSGTLGTAAFARRLAIPVWVSPAPVGRQRAGLESVLRAGRGSVLAAGMRPWADSSV